MRTFRFTLSALSLALAVTASAEIYKTTDAEGNVVFTDVPPQNQTESIKLSEGNDYTPPPAPATPVPTINLSPEDQEIAEGEEGAIYDYRSLAIVSPTDDLDIRENAGNVAVSVDVQPSFQATAGHRVQLLLDGELQEGVGSGTNIALTNLNRGTHSLQAQIVDTRGRVLISSNPITFHLKRFSALF